MKEYPKIQSVFKRDEKTHKFIIGEFSKPEFEYLFYNTWIWTEKVDGTNIRIEWIPAKHSIVNPINSFLIPPRKSGSKLTFAGRTDNAQMPPFLLKKLQEIFVVEKLEILYPDISMTLYGEGYGARIQKGGGNYIPDGVDFALFDVLIDGWWLKRKDIEDIALKLGIRIVPIVGSGTLQEAVKFARDGFKSCWGDFFAEGIVIKPRVELKDRAGRRIITKLKQKDF